MANDIATLSPEQKSIPDVGYCRPPVHSRFKPGQSGNPSGRAKGSQNIRTLFNKVLREQVSLREGADVRKVSKAEAVVRGLVIGALKGDPRHVAMLLKLAEQIGELAPDKNAPITQITRVIIGWEDGKPAETGHGS